MKNAFIRRESSHAPVIARPKSLALLAAGSHGPTVYVGTGRAIRCACPWLVMVSIVVLLMASSIPAAAAPLALGLQGILNSATGASAPSASAPLTASAPAPASQAELARSLDNLIGTLDNDTQRNALVTQLKELRDAAQNAREPAAPAQSQPRSAWHDCVRHRVGRDESERGPNTISLLGGPFERGSRLNCGPLSPGARASRSARFCSE